MRYWVDSEDRLAAVDEEWGAFAVENGAPELASPAVLGRAIGSFCSDLTTEEIWQQLFARARAGLGTAVRIRCDAPGKRRLLDVSLSAEGGRVRVTSVLLWAEERPAELLFEVNRPHSAELLHCCSWCKRWRLPSGGWAEVEELVSALRLLERDVLPGVTHAICGDCLAEYGRAGRGL